MNKVQIDNPIHRLNYDLSWLELTPHLLKVVKAFPNEYTIINDDTDNGKLVVLNIPITAEDKAILKDNIIYITCDNISDNSKANVTLTVTNENNLISSYNELNRDKKSLGLFIVLVDKSIKGTFDKSLAKATKNRKPKGGCFKAFLTIISLIVSIMLIIAAIAALK